MLLFAAEDTPGRSSVYSRAMAVTFSTTLMRDDEVNAMGIVVPPDAIERLGAGKRPPVVVTIGAYTYRSTVAVMGGLFLIPLEPGAPREIRDRAGDRRRGVPRAR